MKKRVAVIVQSSRGYGRDILSGIAAYTRAHRSWSIFHDERVLTDSIPDWLADWRGDGMIGGFENEAIIDFARSAGIPAIDLHGEFDHAGHPVIRGNDHAAVELAYHHLRELRFERIAYCGFRGIRFSDEREKHLIELAARDGIRVATLDSPYPHARHTSRIEADGFLDQETLSEWLAGMELPLGVIACNDNRAAQVLNATRRNDLSVPDEVAVVGIDNDSCVCNLCDPPLTSVNLNGVLVGFQAAEALDLMMDGGEPGFRAKRVEPAGIVVRESTSLMVVPDADVAEAIRFIHEKASSGISVTDVVAQVGLSRSTLERRFTKFVGRSIKSEINRVRLRHVEELLTGTNYSLEKIAGIVSFSHAEYMITFFKKAVGVTPGEYRKKHRKLSL